MSVENFKGFKVCALGFILIVVPYIISWDFYCNFAKVFIRKQFPTNLKFAMCDEGNIRDIKAFKFAHAMQFEVHNR